MRNTELRFIESKWITGPLQWRMAERPESVREGDGERKAMFHVLLPCRRKAGSGLRRG